MPNSEDYKGQLLKLLPRGIIWAFEDEDNLPKLFHAFGDECAILDGAVQAFLNDFFPDTTAAFLPDWERVAGLPDPCSGLGQTTAIRRKDLISKITAQGGQSREFFINLAAELGYTVTITEFKPFRAGINRAGDPLCGIEWWFAWQVNSALNTIEYFRAGVNAAGDPLASWGNDRLECVFNRLKPAHTVALFSYS